jgi:hypothetical protein
LIQAVKFKASIMDWALGSVCEISHKEESSRKPDYVTTNNLQQAALAVMNIAPSRPRFI